MYVVILAGRFFHVRDARCLNRFAILFMEFFQISPKAMVAGASIHLEFFYQHLSCPVFASLRAYALSRKFSVGIVIFALALLPSVLDCVGALMMSRSANLY